MSTGLLMIFGLSLMIPVAGLLYVKLEKFILRRAGIPPIEEVASLKMPQPSDEVDGSIDLRKAA